MIIIAKKRFRFFIVFLFLVALAVLPGLVSGATVTSFSDSLSDSRPTTASNHTIAWDVVDATGIAEGDTVVITFDANFDTSSIVVGDVDWSASGKGEITLAANCAGADMASAVMAADVLTLTPCAGDFGAAIASGEVVTIEIGTNAAGGTHQITNPAAGSYTIDLTSTGYTDTGEVQVAVIAGVTATADVSASLSLSVAAVAAGQAINGATTTILSTSSTMPFGTLVVSTPAIGAHTVTVSTNAAEGYTTTLRKINGTGTTGVLTSAANDIDGFLGAALAATNANPLAWLEPTGAAANTNTGWYGYTTEDSTLGTGAADRFTSAGGNKWAPFDVTPYEVMYNNAPVSGQAIKIGHEIEVNALQPQGSYSGVVEYIATAIF